MLGRYLYTSQKYRVPQKYRDKNHFNWIIEQYITLFDFCKQESYKKVLDFGCGIGMAQTVHETLNYDEYFELRLADMDEDWNGEQELFNTFRNNLGTDYYTYTDVTKDNFKFITNPDIKFDAVIATRFPPLSNLVVSTENFKKRLSPYCESDFDLVYGNISQTKADRLNLSYDIKLYNKPCKKQYDDDRACKLMVF